MPRWWVSEPYENLCISDKPLSYSDVVRWQEMSFQLYYGSGTDYPRWMKSRTFIRRAGHEYFWHPLGSRPLCRLARIGGMTNAAWGNNWMMDIIFWDTNSESQAVLANQRMPPDNVSSGYEALVFRPRRRR